MLLGELPTRRAEDSAVDEPDARDAVAEDDLPSEVHRALADYLSTRVAECADLDPDFAESAEQLVEFVLRGGKRIRPTFAWWGWRAAGGAADGPAARAMLSAASALELIQACALVHDDLIDDSRLRRGFPTVHEDFAGRHQTQGWAGPPQRFGMAAAVLLGDLALSWADDMLHTAGMDAEPLARALRPWRAMRTEVLAGQHLDILAQVRGDESAQSAIRVSALKAASYTVQRPLEFGALAGGAGADVLAALDRFGADIGVAFQLRDDLLGVFGDSEITGKPAGDDLREGKRTLLIAETLHRAGDQGDQQTLDLVRAALGEADLDEARVEHVCAAMRRVGGVQAVEDRITELTGTAMEALRSVELPEPAGTRLVRLAVAATDRSA